MEPSDIITVFIEPPRNNEPHHQEQVFDEDGNLVVNEALPLDDENPVNAVDNNLENVEGGVLDSGEQNVRRVVDRSLHDQVESILKAGQIPGCTLAIWDVKRNKSLLKASVGVEDLQTMHDCQAAATAFHAFSTTKLYTATAIMCLVDQKKITVQDTVESILSKAPESAKYHYNKLLPFIGHLTLHQLLSHSSGLSDSPLSAVLGVHSSNSNLMSTAEVLGKFSVTKMPSATAKASYANINYAILGEIVSVISKIPYEEFVEEQVLKPLGSLASFSCGQRKGAMATGYVNWLARLALYVLTPSEQYQALFRPLSWYPGDWFSRYHALGSFDLNCTAIGGLVGTVDDFTSIFQLCRNGSNSILTRESKLSMFELQAVGSCGVCSRDGMGYGWKHGTSSSGRKFFNHEGGGGGYTAEIRFYPETQVGIVLLMNKWSIDMSECTVAHRICELFCSKVDELSKKSENISMDLQAIWNHPTQV